MVLRIAAPLASVLILILGCQAPDTGASGSASSLAAVSAGGEEAGTVVAQIGDDAITLGALDQWIKDDLFDRQSGDNNPAKLFDMRRPALDELILERVLEAEAARRNTSVDVVIEADIEARGEITDEEVSEFFAENQEQMGDQELEQIAPRIREYLGQVRGQEVAEALVAVAGVSILLDRPRVEIAGDGPSKGPADATVTIVEFSDFQCPFCSRAIPVVTELLERYPQDVRIVYRHLPLDRIHPRARAAAEASLCADAQDQFWPYHDLLFANSRTLGEEDLKRFAGEANLDVPAFEKCMTDGTFKAKVDEDVEAARAAGITGTPAFIVNGVVLSGAKPVEEFVPLIEAELERAKAAERT
jgi:protein-disulfide isomerase